MFEKYEKLVAMAIKAGFEKAEAFYSESSSFSVSVYEGEIDDYSVEATAGLSLRGLIGGQMGYASTEETGEDAFDELIFKAKENALLLESEDKSFLYDGKETLDWTSAVNPKLDEVTAGEKIALAKKLEKKCFVYDKRVTKVPTSNVATESDFRLLVNSEGCKRTFSRNYALAYAETIVDDGKGGQMDGMAYKVTNDFAELNADAIAKEAVEDALCYVGAQSIPSGNMPIVMRNDAMATLLKTFQTVFFGYAAQKGMSLLKEKEGEFIASPILTLWDDPSDGLGLAGKPFDGEGVPTRKKAVIENGKLNTLLYTLKSANMAGKTTTGNASRGSYRAMVGTSPSNLYIAPTETPVEELYAQAGNGVRIDSMMGMHSGANPISGDFSLLAKGMRIENGVLTTPVEQITISGNFYEVLKSITAIGSDLKFGFPGDSAVGAPSVLLAGLTVTGK